MDRLIGRWKMLEKVIQCTKYYFIDVYFLVEFAYLYAGVPTYLNLLHLIILCILIVCQVCYKETFAEWLIACSLFLLIFLYKFIILLPEVNPIVQSFLEAIPWVQKGYIHIFELGFVPFDAPVGNRVFSSIQGIVDAVICIFRVKYLDNLFAKNRGGYFDDPKPYSSYLNEIYAFGSIQDLLNRAMHYIYIIMIILFVHLPKLMLMTLVLVIMCDPTFLNMVLLILLFVKIKKGVSLYPRWADCYLLCIMPLLIQIPVV